MKEAKIRSVRICYIIKGFGDGRLGDEVISIEEDREIERMKKSTVIAICLLLLEPQFSFGIEASPLVTNDGEHQTCEDCLPISECPALQILAEKDKLGELKKYDWCGYESGEILMCCPQSDVDDDEDEDDDEEDDEDLHSPLQHRSKDHHSAKGT